MSVSVNLHGLYPYFQYCHMDGVILDRNDNENTCCVHLENNRKMIVSQDRVSHQRSAESDRIWDTGDVVEVLEKNNGVKAWWEAIIIQKIGDEWQIAWRGDYQIHGKITCVNSN